MLGRMRPRSWHLALALASLLQATSARAADEDDDDPKAKHSQAAQAGKKAATPPRKIAHEEPSPAMPAPARKETAPARKPESARAEEPTRKAETAAPAPAAQARAPKSAEAKPMPVRAGAGRAVRAQLVDGSTVVGHVHAEEPEALVIDCALGQLSIPRGRLSQVTYDAAAAVDEGEAQAGAAEPGFVTVSADPWGAVFVDGKRIADQTPVYRYQVAAGRHKVSVYNPERKATSPTRVVVVKPGETATVGFEW
jgi:hypothetical protein